MAVKAGVCPRCIGGSLQIEYQNDGFWHEWCLSCSYDRELSPDDPRIPRDKKIREACEVKGYDRRSIQNIEHRSAKDSFKEALAATIEWSKQKKG